MIPQFLHLCVLPILLLANPINLKDTALLLYLNYYNDVRTI